MSKRDDDDAVGYGKPPKATRFGKGQSGNPKGRPKGSRNFPTDLDEILETPMTITENGRPKKVTSQMAALMRLREKALKGDGRALDRILYLAAERSADRAAQSAERTLNASEDEILARFEEDLLAKAGITIDATDHGEADDED